MKYRILTAYSTAALSDLVNAAIAEGWWPIGGVAVSMGHPVGVGHKTEYEHYSQALELLANISVLSVESAAPVAAPASVVPPKKKFGLF